MSKPAIHGKRAVVSASAVLTALGDALGRIRQEDGLTWGDIGRVMGRSDDQAAKYADATAEMGVTQFYFAKKEWNGRFTADADKLVDATRDEISGHHAQSQILAAALALSIALEDGELSEAEIRANRSTLCNARDAIDAQLQRLAPKGVA